MGRMYQSNYMTPDSLDDVRRLAHNALDRWLVRPVL